MIQEVAGRVYKPSAGAQRQATLNQRVVENVIVPLTRLPRGCVEKKVLLAAASCFSESALRALCHSLGDSDARLFSQESLALARQHQTLLSGGHVLPTSKHTRARGSDSVVQSAVRFILDPDRAVKLAHGEITLPDGTKAASTVRTQAIGTMWKQYCASVVAREDRIGRARFYALAQAMTSAKQSARGSIDTFYSEYGLLTHDRLKKLIDNLDELLEPADAAIIISPLRSVNDFVFKFLHEDYRLHLRHQMSSSPDPPPPQPIVSFRSRHKYQTMAQHVALPAVVLAADHSDSDSSVGDEGASDDDAQSVSSVTSSNTDDDEELDQQLTAALNASLRPLSAAERLARRGATTAQQTAGVAPVAPSLPMLAPPPPPAVASVAVHPPPPQAAHVQPPVIPHDCCHDMYAALVDDAIGVAPSQCAACNACEQLFVYLRSRIGLVHGAAPILAAVETPALEAAIAAADDPARARKVAQLAAAVERFHINYRCWRAHMLRAIVQGDAVDQAVVNLTPDTALLLMDFKVRNFTCRLAHLMMVVFCR